MLNVSKLACFRKGAIARATLSSYLSFIGLSNILQQPIRTLYPEVTYNFYPHVQPFEINS